MKTSILAYGKSGYVWNEESNQLEWFELKQIKLDFAYNCASYIGSINGTEKSLSEDTVIYDSTDQFKTNDKESAKQIWHLKDAMLATCGWYPFSNKDNEVPYIEAFYWDEAPLFMEVEELEFVYNLKDETYKMINFDRLYPTKNDVFYDHGFSVVSEDGTEHEFKSYKERLAMTIEQKEAFQKVVTAIKEAGKAGVEVVVDTRTDKVYGFNISQVSNWGICDPGDVRIRKEDLEQASISIETIYLEDGIYVNF